MPLPEIGALGYQSQSHLEPGAASHHKWVLPGGEKGGQVISGLGQFQRSS